MSIPTIYCNKKQALPNEEITVFADIGRGEWRFPNAATSDIIIVEGDITSNVMTFKCLRDYDPLIVGFAVIINQIKNGAIWEDTQDRGLGDYWNGLPSQENIIYTGWNFDGRSQHVNQTTITDPKIWQSNLTVSGGDYSVELDYRATKDLTLKVGGSSFVLSASDEGEPFNIYPIVHGAGLFEFTVANATGIQWIFPNDTTSVNSSVFTTLPAGTTYLTVDDFSTVNFYSWYMGDKLVGDLSDIPSGVNSINFEDTATSGILREITHISDTIWLPNCVNVSGTIGSFTNLSTSIELSGCGLITGNIAALRSVSTHVGLHGHGVQGAIVSLSGVSSHVDLATGNIYGDISELSGVSDYIDLSYPAVRDNISGDIGTLSGTDTVILDGTDVKGYIKPMNECSYWSLDNTSLSAIEISQSLINLAGYATSFNIRDGYFRCKDGMPFVIDELYHTVYLNGSGPQGSGDTTSGGYEMWATIKTLESLGWVIDVNYYVDENWEYDDEWWWHYYYECYWQDYGGDWICTMRRYMS